MWSTGLINSKIKLNYSIISHKFEIDYRTSDADGKLLQKKILQIVIHYTYNIGNTYIIPIRYNIGPI